MVNLDLDMLVCVSAFRRRSGSCGTVHEDDRASPFYSKKPRYSFTDEQKNMLREAFRNDPYPTSSAIDTLAISMDLSAKTVTNWFHNHRMRSKQQNREDGGGKPGPGGIYIKQEPDSNSLDGAQFSSQNSYTTDSQNSSPDPAPAAGSVASPDSTNPITPPGPPDGSQSTHCTSTPNNNINNTRKRKSANPQYVSAGAVLDKHSAGEDDDGVEIDVTGLSECPQEGTSQPDMGEAACAPLLEGSVEGSKAKIAKLEQRVREDDMKWEEAEQVDRVGCLQKLETSVNTDSNSADDWEF